jgi:hypothetical protein
MFPGLRSGITVDYFHCGGTVDEECSTLNRCRRGPLISGDRCLMLLTRSGPTALLLYFGRLLLSSSVVMVSFSWLLGLYVCCC